MGLQLSKTLDTGEVVVYHRIIEWRVIYRDQIATVTIASYVSKALRDSGAPYVRWQELDVSNIGTLFPAEGQAETKVDRPTIYTVLKNLAYFNGAADA